ncbi:hypothetical protein VRK_21170 [Vibrio sp. MEBiC08052]|nr:hypothetical protein VRK_21170 [Vibrio sp. MEBiC08052]
MSACFPLSSNASLSSLQQHIEHRIPLILDRSLLNMIEIMHLIS